jgi:hypothetical protein
MDLGTKMSKFPVAESRLHPHRHNAFYTVVPKNVGRWAPGDGEYAAVYDIYHTYITYAYSNCCAQPSAQSA